MSLLPFDLLSASLDFHHLTNLSVWDFLGAFLWLNVTQVAYEMLATEKEGSENIVYPESKSYFKHCNIQILEFQYFISRAIS